MISCKQELRSLGSQQSTDYPLDIFPPQGKGAIPHGVWLRKGVARHIDKSQTPQMLSGQALSLLTPRECQTHANVCGGDKHSSGVPCLSDPSDNKNYFLLTAEAPTRGMMNRLLL